MNRSIVKIALGAAAGLAGFIGAAAQAQAPSWNGQYDDPPRGAYTRSCREITAFQGQVWALCKTGNGRWNWSSARVNDCRSGLENYDGRLSCGGWNGGGGGPGGGGGGGGGSRGEIVLFEDQGYSGRAYEVIGDIPDLGMVKFNDRASSIKINRGAAGRWEICEHTNYQGRCSKLDADQFTLPREWNDQISSIRRVR